MKRHNNDIKHLHCSELLSKKSQTFHTLVIVSIVEGLSGPPSI